jgi:hypothetical protein
MTCARLSDAGALEFNRRVDIAYAMLPSAAHFLGLRTELTAQIAMEKKQSASPWYWIVGLVGVALHYVFAPADAKFSFGLWLSLMAFAYWAFKGHTISKLQERRYACTESLMRLAASWHGAIGHETFWDIERFVADGFIDREDDAFLDWWSEQREMICARCAPTES